MRFNCQVITRSKTRVGVRRGLVVPSCGSMLRQLPAKPTPHSGNSLPKSFATTPRSSQVFEVHFEQRESSPMKLNRMDHPGRVLAEIFD